jgi:hypothetical protein
MSDAGSLRDLFDLLDEPPSPVAAIGRSLVEETSGSGSRRTSGRCAIGTAHVGSAISTAASAGLRRLGTRSERRFGSLHNDRR